MNRVYNFLNSFTKSRKTISLAIICSLSLLSSCKKNILEKSPTASYSDNDVWKSPNLISNFIDNTYRQTPTGYTYRSLKLASLTDEIYSRGGGNNIINGRNVTPAALGMIDFWVSPNGYSYWPIITKCNIFFQNIEAAPVEAGLKSRMIGEMKFLRAYAYFNLVSLYGGVPLITKVFGLSDEFNQLRNTYDECMRFVITELDEAAAVLPLTYTAANLGRVSKGAALTAKSRALLNMASPLNNATNAAAKWQAAADAAKAVIDLKLYSLFPSYKDQFLRVNTFNAESIWARPYNFSVSPEGTYLELELYPNGYSGYGQVAPFHNLVDEYEMISGKLPKEHATYNPQNPYINRDPRFYASILYDGASFKNRIVETFVPAGRDSREGIISSWNATETGYYVRKFVDESITDPSETSQGNQPWIFFRYAEILLNYAEASYFLGQEATSKEYLNMVRSRPCVNMPAVTETGGALLARIQHEHQIELVFEDHRWFDIRRWKIAPVVLNKLPKRIDIVKKPVTGAKTYTVNTMGIT